MKGKVSQHSQHMCAVRRGLGWLCQCSISSYTDPATGRVGTSALEPKPQAHHCGDSMGFLSSPQIFSLATACNKVSFHHSVRA